MHFLLLDGAGRLLLRRRPSKGLLGGMLELPGTPGGKCPGRSRRSPLRPLPGLSWQVLEGEAKHGFTHFELHMALRAATAPPGADLDGDWMTVEAARAALPGTMQKLLDLARAEGALPGGA
ncbi:NUDIX domain-containing protein [Pseudoroseomonas wenyumeiae]